MYIPSNIHGIKSKIPQNDIRWIRFSVVLDISPVISVLIPMALDLIPVKRKPKYKVFSGVFLMKLRKYRRPGL